MSCTRAWVHRLKPVHGTLEKAKSWGLGQSLPRSRGVGHGRAWLAEGPGVSELMARSYVRTVAVVT